MRTDPRLITTLGPQFHDLDQIQQLKHSTVVVVDLETTGTQNDAEITEIGAIRSCSGEINEVFQTLVRPLRSIPEKVQRLTGITDDLVGNAPPIEQVLPGFADFLGSDILVAHNAPFDVGFLRRAFSRNRVRWPDSPVIDTVSLARSLIPRTEVRDFKLGTLSAHFRVKTPPSHRALSDAYATLDLLYALLDRVD